MAESRIELEKMDEKEVDVHDVHDDDDAPVGDGFFAKNHKMIMTGVKLVLLAGWLAFLGYGIFYAISIDPEHDVIWYYVGITIFCVVCWVLGTFVMPHLSAPLGKLGDAFGEFNEKNWKWLRFVYAVLVLAYFFGAGLATGIGNPIRFTSVAGYVAFILLTYLCSAHRKEVSFRAVGAGLLIQYTMALLVLRTMPGEWLFEWIGGIVTTFLGCVSAGASFVFGNNYADHFFAFSVVPTICYFACFTAIMYHIGAMGFVISKIAGFLQVIIGTSAAETLSAAGNIFVGQTEAPLLIKPFIGDMTKSEIHAVMTGGFATVAGGVLAAFIGMGVSAEHLMAASVMAAPCALAMSKLSYPETEQSKTGKGVKFSVPRGNADSVLEAAATGAAESVPLMLNVVAMLIAFLSLLAAINTLLGSLGGCIGVPQLSVEWLCQYLFLPFAYLLGVQGEDALLLAQLIGKKMILNEFVGYSDLSTLLMNRKCGREPQMSYRAETIATYAMCGFANFSSIGIQLGGLTPLAPHRAKDFSELVFRAMLTGTVTSFVNANVAGFLLNSDGPVYEAPYPPECNPTTKA